MNWVANLVGDPSGGNIGSSTGGFGSDGNCIRTWSWWLLWWRWCHHWWSWQLNLNGPIVDLLPGTAAFAEYCAADLNIIIIMGWALDLKVMMQSRYHCFVDHAMIKPSWRTFKSQNPSANHQVLFCPLPASLRWLVHCSPRSSATYIWYKIEWTGLH